MTRTSKSEVLHAHCAAIAEEERDQHGKDLDRLSAGLSSSRADPIPQHRFREDRLVVMDEGAEFLAP